ncbi:DNA alkylation repair protein [Salipiger sp. P9]|uniref:DNA alkylation repair protein n=1 Tax=Salipiger pentaromativorans TaxID=2943193 RepID=UPI0021578398|nr:DNA alkylation repair protein [Salipiger pentaromativorans]MCR8547041.1 DNA alkylation repair protein [Salipiger pentaromativorans]
MTPEAALAEIAAHAVPGRAEEMRAYHKVDRTYLGVPNPVLNDLTRAWRPGLDVEARVALARGLWDSDVFEARLAAAKLLTQARIRPDDSVWALIQSWVPDFDSWAIADHACQAGQRRLTADHARIDTVEGWVQSPHMWTRRAALVITLPWARLNHPSEADLAIRDRVLGWAASYVPDRDWFIQKAVAWWVRDLSKHDVPRAQGFLDAHGGGLKPFALREASKYL